MLKVVYFEGVIVLKLSCNVRLLHIAYAHFKAHFIVHFSVTSVFSEIVSVFAEILTRLSYCFCRPLLWETIVFLATLILFNYV